MKIGNFSLYTSAAAAREMGCTHHAMMWNIIPGYFGEDAGVWCPVSDLLAPVEDVVTWVMCSIQEMRGLDPQFGFRLGAEIDQ